MLITDFLKSAKITILITKKPIISELPKKKKSKYCFFFVFMIVFVVDRHITKRCDQQQNFILL